MYRYAKRMENSEPSIIRELLKKSIEPDFISFAGGDPDPAFYPTSALMDFEHNEYVKDNFNLFQYGISEGNDILRNELVNYMSSMEIPTSKENLLITTGSQQALDLTGKLFLDEGDKIVVENPSYMGAINAFRLYAPQITGIKMDEDGINIDELERYLEANNDIKFLYTIPDFQNPTGISMSYEKRLELIRLADKYDFLIIEDNPYYKLRYSGTDIPSLKSIDKSGKVIYLGSVSKSVCPGLRIGWICADKKLIEEYVVLKQSTDIHTNELSQLQLASFLKNIDFEKYMNNINKGYKKKRDAMINSLEKYLPGNVSFTRPEGGLFVWLTLPQTIDSYELLDVCLDEKISIIPGSNFYISNPQNNTIRLSFSTMNEDKIEEGIKLIAKIIKSHM